MPGERFLSTSDEEHLRLANALRESEILRELAALLASSLDLAHILQVLVKRTTEVCEVERCSVWLLQDPMRQLLPTSYHLSAPHLNEQHVEKAKRIWPTSSISFDDPTIHALLEQDEPLIVNNLRSLLGLRSIADQFFIRSVLLVPLRRDGHAVGMLSLDNPGQTYHFSHTQLALVRAIGQQAAIAIGNAQLYNQAQMEHKRAELLVERVQSIYEVANAVNTGVDNATVLKIALQNLISVLSADGAAIALLREDTLSLVSSFHLHPELSNAPISPTLVELPHCCATAINATPCFVRHEEVAGIEKQWYQQLGLQNVLIAPLILGPQRKRNQTAQCRPLSETSLCIGFAFVNYTHPAHTPSKGEYAFARDVATQCALAIEKERIITEAQQAAALATERANTINAVLDAMNEGITVTNLRGETTISNIAASRFLQLPLYSKHQMNTFLHYHPAFTMNGQRMTEQEFPLSRALRGEHIRGERFIAQRGKGSEHIIEVSIAPLFDGQSQQVGVVSAFRDVTEQASIDQRIRRALETILHTVEAVAGLTDTKEILCAVLTRTQSALNSERSIIQLYDQEQKTFTPLLAVGFSKKQEKQWQSKQLQIHDQAIAYSEELYAQLSPGHARLIRANDYVHYPDPLSSQTILVAPIVRNNHLLGVMTFERKPAVKRRGTPQKTVPLGATAKHSFTTWDMALVEGIAQFAGVALEEARWQKEAATARMNEAAMRESNAQKDQFLAITAHEFRTPLTVILAHSQMMSRIMRKAAPTETKTRDRFQESIQTIDEQAHQLTNIVNTFLEVTQLNRGKLQLALEKLDLAEIAEQVVTMHKTTATSHTISCVIAFSEQPYTVLGDKARLTQIFANMLQNAIKYSPFGGPITVSLRQYSNNGQQTTVEVKVQDSGIGVPLEAQPHLFERFYRASNIEGSKTRGVGLGLYLVAEFLRLHGGTICVESSGVYGQGSTFIFTLPIVATEEIYSH